MTILTLEKLTIKNSVLNRMISTAKQLIQLNSIFHASWDCDIAKHCQIAEFSKGEMALIVDNSSWATRLRYLIPELIKILRTQPEFKKLTSIKYQIKTKTTEPEATPSKPKSATEKRCAKQLHQVAKKVAAKKNP